MTTPSFKGVALRDDRFIRAILNSFAKLPDHRLDRAKRHRLVDIVAIAFVGVLVGCESFVEIEDWAKRSELFLRHFLELPNGIPSHDTFGRVLAKLDSTVFREQIIAWQQHAIALLTGRLATANGDQVCIDGKTARRSFDFKKSQKPLHLLSAWTVGSSILLGQMRTEEHSNEITALPELIGALDIAGAMVTIDAMACQHDIARAITAKSGDYLLAVKGNQPALLTDIELFFSGNAEWPFTEYPCDETTTENSGHGRQEKRRCVTCSGLEWLRPRHQWTGLKCIVMMESTRTVRGKTSVERRYFISSRTLTAAEAAQFIRNHWHIENRVHWILDVVYREDDCRVRSGNAAENLCLLRRAALALIRKDPDTKRSFRRKRKLAGWDPEYAIKLLTFGLEG